MRKPRIIFFDYWTKGIHKFLRIMAEGPDAAEYQLFHLGSYRDPSVPDEEVIHGLRCVDIRSFPGLQLDEILGELRPDVVVGLNLATLFDRALFLTCSRLGIPAVFLQHGSWLDKESFRTFAKSLDRGFNVMDRVRRLPAFSRVLPWYLRARKGSWLDFTPWQVVWNLAKTPTESHFFPLAPQELWPARALVFTEEMAETLADTHCIPRERLEVVGNPELDSAFARAQNPLSFPQRRDLIDPLGLDSNLPILCLLEDSFVEQQNSFGWTDAVRNDRVIELYLACRKAGVQLIVRPHPATRMDGMVRALAGKAGAVVTRALSLIDTIEISDAILATMSTAAETALILAKPILVPFWHIMGQPAMSPYLQYQVATSVNHPGELPGIVIRAVSGQIPPPDLTKFSKKRLGRLEGGSAKRALTSILELAQEKVAL